jgi:hypothetical protein
MIPRSPFTQAEANRATDEWGFNCGPAALAALLQKTSEEVRPLLGDFEAKRYMSPAMMRAALKRVPSEFKVRGTLQTESPGPAWPQFGLVRIQWGGPWCRPEASARARHRKTHWIATQKLGGERFVFDVNGCVWGPYSGWESILIPWLIENVVPGGDGIWWPTHVIEVRRCL